MSDKEKELQDDDLEQAAGGRRTKMVSGEPTPTPPVIANPGPSLSEPLPEPPFGDPSR